MLLLAVSNVLCADRTYYAVYRRTTELPCLDALLFWAAAAKALGHTIETEFRLERIAREAEQLDAAQLRGVLQATWSLWLSERQMMQDLCAAEGIAVKSEVQGAFPLELAGRLARAARLS
jgi:hypothetical protein